MKSASPNRNGSRRGFGNNLLHILLILLITLVSGQGEYNQADLEAMTEAELEDICIKRGFQLVNEESEELTKQDYIEAAQRCLAIEQEMNELLTQYPELADELEEEIKRMEKENAEKQAQVEELENKISHDTINDNPEPEVALHRGEKIEENEAEAGSEELIMSEEIPIESVDDFVSEEEKEATTPDGTENDPEGSASFQTDSDDTETLSDDATPDVGTKIESLNKSTVKEDLTLTSLAIESLRVLVKNAQDDVRRIINLAIPVLQPLFSVGDAAWRQMKSLFLRAREAYEAYQATSMPPSEGSEVAETCDEGIPA
eukprot:CAMPEP_0172375842 /NCGR_PEP_ID=MMETSP1060-20121228/63664_1 /TAXON_ID=37318 /ORGANISM="Pseudo-nitzschia pungens, Strain cf. cingulata" /LENGTH=315 /DNA_ID=CAMNT_0013103129 /DNA_START=122 /DNA_END=1069 /DNA_ORIENTATION=+